ncbi:MAG: hypothetical protein PHU71_06330 [Candidatus Gracilibacteria bacterium]|nr:hypothetical protein [Candidatus Gracilibacteria bacterium]
MIIYTKKGNQADDIEIAHDFKISEKSCENFEYLGMSFKILPKNINWYKMKTQKVNPTFNTILVLCEGNKWVYIANFCTKEEFIAKCEKCFNSPDTKHLYAGIVGEIKKCLSPLFMPIIKE